MQCVIIGTLHSSKKSKDNQKKIVSECMKRIIKIFLLAVLAMFFASLAGIFISEEFVFHNNISGIKDLSGIWLHTFGWNFVINIVIAMIIAVKFGKKDK